MSARKTRGSVSKPTREPDWQKIKNPHVLSFWWDECILHTNYNDKCYSFEFNEDSRVVYYESDGVSVSYGLTLSKEVIEKYTEWALLE